MAKRKEIKRTTVRISNDESGRALASYLDHCIPGKSLNERLVEDLHFAEAVRKHFNYAPIMEILLLMLSNDMSVPKSKVIKEYEQNIDTSAALSMLNNFVR